MALAALVEAREKEEDYFPLLWYDHSVLIHDPPMGEPSADDGPCPHCLSAVPYDFLADVRLALADTDSALFTSDLVQLMLDCGLQQCPNPLPRAEARSIDALACILQFYVVHATSLSERWAPALAKMRLVMEAEGKAGRSYSQLHRLGPKVLEDLDSLVRKLRKDTGAS